jgi:hypothetical protein
MKRPPTEAASLVERPELLFELSDAIADCLVGLPVRDWRSSSRKPSSLS